MVDSAIGHFNRWVFIAGSFISIRPLYDEMEHLVPLLKLDINILSILHHLGSPLG